MKTLIWKEWRETRVISAMFCLLFITANFLLMEVQYLVDHYGRSAQTPHGGIYTMNSVLIIGALCSLLSTIACGAGMVSREVDQGTLGFLTGLPIPLRSLWFVKAWVGFAGACAAVFTIAALGLTFVALNFGGAATGLAVRYDPVSFALVVLLIWMIFTVIYAVSYAASCLNDQTFTSIVFSLFTCCGVGVTVFGIVVALNSILTQKIVEAKNHLISFQELAFYLPFIEIFGNPHQIAAIGVGGAAALTALALHLSYSSFCGGEEARGQRRFRTSLRVLTKWTAVCTSLGAVAYGLAFTPYFILSFHR